MPRPPVRFAFALLACAAGLALSGCLATTALDVATAPVRVAGKAVDMTTTSQSESDENRGRALRKREERYGKLSRAEAKASRRCTDGDRRACDEAAGLREQMADLRGSIPAY